MNARAGAYREREGLQSDIRNARNGNIAMDGTRCPSASRRCTSPKRSGFSAPRWMHHAGRAEADEHPQDAHEEDCAAPPAVQTMTWAAQKRLCARYRHLFHSGKVKCQVTTAVARELVGFIWAIACEVMGRPHATRALS